MIDRISRTVEFARSAAVLHRAGLDSTSNRYWHTAAREISGESVNSSGSGLQSDSIRAVPGAAESISRLARPNVEIDRRDKLQLLEVLRLARRGQGRLDQQSHLLSYYRPLIADLLAATALAALLYFGAGEIKTSYSFYSTPPTLTDQQNYEQFLNDRSGGLGELLYHAELGKAGLQVTTRSSAADVSLSFANFSASDNWQRPVSWAVHAAGSGEISIKFPPNSATAVALFMTDGDSFWRMSKIQSGNITRLADRLYNGRWLVFPVTADERKQGAKSLSFEQFTGSTIAVSALAVFGKSS